MDLTNFEPDIDLLAKLPFKIAYAHRMLLLKYEGDQIIVAMSNPLNQNSLEILNHYTHAEILVSLVREDHLKQILNHSYNSAQDILC